jgi:hypothetical protein
LLRRGLIVDVDVAWLICGSVANRHLQTTHTKKPLILTSGFHKLNQASNYAA